MTPEQRSEKIELYGSAHQLLTAALAKFPTEMWQFRATPNSWTIHEIIVHITDSEVNSYVRCRRLLAEPGGTVIGYDEVKWAHDLHYHQQSTDDALALFKLLRGTSYNLIKSAPSSVWSHIVHHTEDGEMTMDTWLDNYASHIPDHIAQMEDVYAAWLAQTG